jgi:hypothetical protein
MYFTDASAGVTRMRDFLQNFTAYLPSGVTITVPTVGFTYEAITGELSGEWTAAATDPVIGGYTGAYAAATGLSVLWRSNSIVQGRRLRGRSYIVPLGGGIFDVDGTINNTALTLLTEASNVAMLPGGGNFVIWGRPVPATPQWTDVKGRVHPAKPSRPGSVGSVVALSIRDVAAVLTSRRQ